MSNDEEERKYGHLDALNDAIRREQRKEIAFIHSPIPLQDHGSRHYQRPLRDITELRVRIIRQGVHSTSWFRFSLYPISLSLIALGSNSCSSLSDTDSSSENEEEEEGGGEGEGKGEGVGLDDAPLINGETCELADKGNCRAEPIYTAECINFATQISESNVKLTIGSSHVIKFFCLCHVIAQDCAICCSSCFTRGPHMKISWHPNSCNQPQYNHNGLM